MQHIGCGLLHVKDVCNGGITKSWILIEGDKELLGGVQQPDPMLRDVDDRDFRTMDVRTEGLHQNTPRVRGLGSTANELSDKPHRAWSSVL